MRGIKYIVLAGLMALVACNEDEVPEEVVSGCILTQMTTPWAVFDFVYDGEGKMVQVSDLAIGGDQVNTWDFSYDERDVEKISSSQGVEISFFYEAGQLSYFEWDEDGLPPAEYTYILSFSGNSLVTMMQVPGSVYNLAWNGGNISQISRRDEDGTLTVSSFTYDDKRAPYTNLPFLLSVFGDPRYLSRNNIIREEISYPESTGSLDGYAIDYTYTYNENGFPVEVSWVNSLGGQSASPTLFGYRCN